MPHARQAGFSEEDIDGTWRPYGPVGCDKCKGSGYKGRVGIYQVMPISDEMRQLIMRSGTALDIAEQAQKEGGSEIAETTHATPAINDPFAAHSPIHSAKAQAMPVPAAEEATAMSVAAGAGSAAATTVLPSPVSGGEDTEIHRKAQRFARLLMDEIKLYNQAKVAEGRKHKDLYDRMKDDIEKSRSTYQKRYGNTAAARANYFQQEVVRSLAEDDLTIMGANFHN